LARRRPFTPGLTLVAEKHSTAASLSL